jgi:hypothetical protein
MRVTVHRPDGTTTQLESEPGLGTISFIADQVGTYTVHPVPDEAAAGERVRDLDLLVTVRLYGPGSAEDAARALVAPNAAFGLDGGGEVEILAARPVSGIDTLAVT